MKCTNDTLTLLTHTPHAHMYVHTQHAYTHITQASIQCHHPIPTYSCGGLQLCPGLFQLLLQFLLLPLKSVALALHLLHLLVQGGVLGLRLGVGCGELGQLCRVFLELKE